MAAMLVLPVAAAGVAQVQQDGRLASRRALARSGAVSMCGMVREASGRSGNVFAPLARADSGRRNRIALPKLRFVASAS